MRVATEHFLRDGYHRTSMVDIAARIGITSTALYRHFRNKEELLTRSVLDGIDEMLAGLEHATTLEQIIGHLAGSALDGRGLPALWQREMRYLSRDTRRMIMNHLVKTAERTRSAITAERPDLPAADGELIAWCLLSLFESVSHHEVSLPRDQYEALLRSLAYRVAYTDLPRGSAFDDREIAIEPVIPTPSQTDGASRRDQLLAAAAHLFSRHGYASVGIDDIGAMVGITGPSVYYHFRSKSDLLAEIIDRTADATETYTARALAEARDPADALELLLRYYLSFAFTHRDLVWVAVTELTHLPADVVANHRTRQRVGIMRWTHAVVAARPELDEPAARIVAQAVVMIVNDIVRLPWLLRRHHIRDELFTVGMAAQAPAARAAIEV